jgi:hypothetical protein
MSERTISATRSTVMMAMEAVINKWLIESMAMAAGENPDQVARIQTNAETQEELVARLIEGAMQTALDFGRTAVSIQIDGLRPIESSWRVWGTVGLVANGDDSNSLSAAPTRVEIAVSGGETTVSLTYPVPNEL